MKFDSIDFIIFLPLVLLLFYVVSRRWRWLVLLAASYYFYAAWQPAFLLLILTSTTVSYVAALLMARAKRPRTRNLLLFTALLVNFGQLFFFKYYEFFAVNLRAAILPFDVGEGLPRLDLLLPVGISFYTFQTVSYLIDVQRGKKAPERHPGKFALFVAFFPQLVAGPIERAGHLLPQLSHRRGFNPDQVASGLQRVLWGLFKKVVIADNLSIFVNRIYDNPEPFSGPTIALATFFFGIQIYADFSGYSDIAIGSARMLGIDLSENFRFPYIANSIANFWQRWHMSLYGWFRDYVYIPMGGSRVRMPRRYANVLVVFLISGLWHGAAWNFVIWGGIHGAYIIVWNMVQRIFRSGEGSLAIESDSGRTSAPPLVNLLGTITTLMIVTFAWIFFRADNLEHAFEIIRRLGSGWPEAPLTADWLEFRVDLIEADNHDLRYSLPLVGLVFLEPLAFRLAPILQGPNPFVAAGR